MSDKRRITPADLRSKAWFDNPHNPGMTALYLERYLNYGLTPEELRSGKPLIGIAQTGSDLSPCNRHHVELAKRVRDGITAAGGVAFEFPCHPIQETGKRPTASLDRNLAYLSLVEVLYGYPLDGVVLLTGCDKTMPACLMAAATVNIPAISLNVGPMLNGYFQKELTGSGTIVWKTRERHAAGDIDFQQFMDIVGSSAPSTGHCNTMGTASTMNALAEALGLALPGSAAIPAPYRERGQAAYATGQRIVEMVWEDLKPSDILTRESFENAIVANAAIGGSTNAPIHINAIAKHIGVPLSCDDWERVGFEIPLLVDMQPAGRWLGEEYFRAGGLPAVFAELIEAGKVHEGALTCNGRTVGENYRGRHSWNRDVIRAYGEPLMERAGFLNLKGSLFDSAIMKTCVISEEFAARYLRNPNDPMAFEGRVIVFDGPEDYHTRIDDPALDIDENTILIMRGAGRQSGTSGTPAILNASPEAAAGGGLALLQSGDRIRIDLNRRSADILLPAEEIARRRADLAARGGYPYPATQTPWQEIYRDQVDQLDQGMVLKGAVKFQKVAQASGVPRDNH
jgi:dihydroxy-acid dehydratase